MPRRGKNQRRRKRAATTTQTDTRMLRAPTVMPTISQGAISERWVRFMFSRPATGTWYLSQSSVYNSVFGSVDANSRYSYLYLLGFRVWLESGGEQTSSLIIRVPPHPYVSTSSVDTANSAAFYRDDGEAGHQYACISVRLPELWRINPIGPLDANLVTIIDTASTSTVALIPIVTNTPTVTIDVRVKLHQNSLPVTTISEIENFESLTIRDQMPEGEKIQKSQARVRKERR